MGVSINSLIYSNTCRCSLDFTPAISIYIYCFMYPAFLPQKSQNRGMFLLTKSHKIALITYRHLVAFLSPDMDDMVQSQNGN